METSDSVVKGRNKAMAREGPSRCCCLLTRSLLAPAGRRMGSMQGLNLGIFERSEVQAAGHPTEPGIFLAKSQLYLDIWIASFRILGFENMQLIGHRNRTSCLGS